MHVFYFLNKKQVCNVVANSHMTGQYTVVAMVVIFLCVVLHERMEMNLINTKVELKFVN